MTKLAWRVNFKNLCCVAVANPLLYMSEQGTEAPHVTTQRFSLGNLSILDLVCMSGSWKWRALVYKLF